MPKRSPMLFADSQTHFAPPQRRTREELQADVIAISRNPVIDNLMAISNGLFAVLNDKRQVVALNDSFMKMVGIEDVEEALGLRPGEYVKCIHACDMEAGCGTSEYCSTCGAVLSILSALTTNKPQEQSCALTIEKDNQDLDLYFSVRSCPITIDDSVFILFFMQDISAQQYRSCLERSFFHDISNILCALSLKSELLASRPGVQQDKIQELYMIVQRVVQEVTIQHNLMNSLEMSCQPLYSDVSVNALLAEIELVFRDHPLTLKRSVEIEFLSTDVILKTDFHLTCRILVNMVTNALEASDKDGSVRVYCEPDANAIALAVWNDGVIGEDVAKRLFQKNFSTKGTLGRGFGTYSMKLFGEQILGGRVTFESSAAGGTIFRFSQLCV